VRRLLLVVLAALVVCVTGGPLHAAESVAGRLLVAQPSLVDANFSKSVVLILRHDANGAFGLIVNRFVDRRSPQGLLALFGEDAPDSAALVAVHLGGPIQPQSTLVLHSTDFVVESTERVGDTYAVSPTVDTMIAIARGKGPAALRVLFGYAGWAPGQLDREIDSGSWAVLDADEDLVFADDAAAVWSVARGRIRLDL